MDDFSLILNMAMGNPWLFLIVTFITTVISAIRFFQKRAKQKAEDEARLLIETKKVQQTIAELSVKLGDNLNTDRLSLLKMSEHNVDAMKKWK